MAIPTTRDDWLNFIDQTVFNSYDYDYIQSCSISIVPEGLKKSNEDAYMPRVVCIGPRFKGSREDLLLMEKVKWRCLLSLIRRAGIQGEGGEYLNACSNAIWELDEEVRASYAADINLEKHELATTMLLDGCFLLELLISKGMDAQLPSRTIPPGPAPELLKDDDVLSDLMLFENQIPILLLHTLSQILFPNVFEPDREEQREEEEEQRKRGERARTINNLVRSVLGYSLPLVQSLEATHILDIVHFFVNRRAERETEIREDFNHVVVVPPNYVKLELKRCALRLLTWGITIKLPEDTDSGVFSCYGLLRKCFSGILTRLSDIFVTTEHSDLDMPAEDLKGLDFEFKFQNGKLEIAQLHITKTTKARWCNVIAWEHYIKNLKRPSIQLLDLRTISINGKFTSAALIFNGLIRSVDDVQLLKDKNIIADHLKMSNHELLAFFSTISFGVNHGVVDSSFIKVVDDLNKYSRPNFLIRIWKNVLISFIYRQEWLLRFMNRNYNFVATVLAVLSIVQTVYAVLTYYFRM